LVTPHGKLFLIDFGIACQFKSGQAQEVPRVDYEKLADKRNVEDSKTIRARVQAARERQLERFASTKIT
jgi:hypothetical protein